MNKIMRAWFNMCLSMPIYEYRCAKCGQDFDRFFSSFKKMTETRSTCPNCASKRVRRLVSASRLGNSEASMNERFDRADHEASSAPGANGLLGRKEIAEITKKRKKAGLPG
jgi:putative FmdB family regulatory protein